MAYYNGPRRKKKVDPSIVRRRTTAEEFEATLSRAKVVDGFKHYATNMPKVENL